MKYLDAIEHGLRRMVFDTWIFVTLISQILNYDINSRYFHIHETSIYGTSLVVCIRNGNNMYSYLYLTTVHISGSERKYDIIDIRSYPIRLHPYP